MMRVACPRLIAPALARLRRAAFAGPDFADNWHLVEPGRTKWQKRLSKWTVHFIDLYGLGAPYAS
jgi:hypothetical protein